MKIFVIRMISKLIFCKFNCYVIFLFEVFRKIIIIIILEYFLNKDFDNYFQRFTIALF